MFVLKKHMIVPKITRLPSPRCYKLQAEEHTLVVNATIRLANLKWDKVIKRSARFGDSQYFLGEDAHNMLESCVREQPADS